MRKLWWQRMEYCVNNCSGIKSCCSSVLERLRECESASRGRECKSRWGTREGSVKLSTVVEATIYLGMEVVIIVDWIGVKIWDKKSVIERITKLINQRMREELWRRKVNYRWRIIILTSEWKGLRENYCLPVRGRAGSKQRERESVRPRDKPELHYGL